MINMLCVVSGNP